MSSVHATNFFSAQSQNEMLHVMLTGFENSDMMQYDMGVIR